MVMAKTPKSAWEYLPAWMGPFVPAIKTFFVAVLGAFLGAFLDSAVTLVTGEGLSPWTHEGLRHMLNAGIASALLVVGAYLQRSPLARKEWSDGERAAHRAKLEAQGRLK